MNTADTIPEPRGVRSIGKSVGIKANNQPDLAIVVSDAPCTSAAVFTQSMFCGPSIVVGRAHAK
ncbi:MAG: bifunctional ornithine acetyltransferase/N-acetylglutamate synthase, partial [Methylococcales bacterium]